MGMQMDEQGKRNLIIERVHGLLNNGAISEAKAEKLIKSIPTTPVDQLDASLQVLDQLSQVDPKQVREFSEWLELNRCKVYALLEQLGLSEKALALAKYNTEMQTDPVKLQAFVEMMEDPEERRHFAEDVESIAALPTWAQLIHPAGHPAMDATTAALVGWLVGHNFVDPKVCGIALVDGDDGEERFRVLDEDGEPVFEAAVEELRDNFGYMFDTVRYTPEERMLAEFAFREKFGVPLDPDEDEALVH